ncbi:unnamed protein product [Closterium sp. NIES-54]
MRTRLHIHPPPLLSLPFTVTLRGSTWYYKDRVGRTATPNHLCTPPTPFLPPPSPPSPVTLRGSTWYYKDRVGRTRGPCEVINLRTAWAAGIIDGNTFVWGDDMDEFAPIDAVYGLKQAIDTPDGEWLSGLVSGGD